MSFGPVGKGVHYWANIQITGELEKAELQKIVQEIKEILAREKVKGKIVSEARLSKSASVTLNATFKAPTSK